MTTYSDSDKQNIKYDMKILNNNEESKIIINYNDINFLINCSDGKCTFINKKFQSNQIECNLPILNYLIEEISLSKFNGIKSKANNTVELNIGLYRYVLEFKKGTYSPRKMMVYKENSLYKNFEYKKIKLYK
ncbi:hypothetical protein JYG23_00850 [Sedimentibacter sp. zth1]|uniref:hypothetical protein n=1 Tax=Sedimentibacter sp. zth1 TaxID=2816908 RepID=UPI001A90FAB2|nr:hypothetical protein [Sedimentibacter sp. zth1]QSX06048.1 hypothetical protein JYG23_00850 [Sedimentibacter sp. zth1]